MEWSTFNFALGGLVLGLGVGLRMAPRVSWTAIRSVALQMSNPTKMVLVVRNDLGMGKGKVAAQCSHAAVQCYIEGQKKQKSVVQQWTMFGQPKVVVKVNSEEELRNLYLQVKSLDLICCIIKDAGRTQLPAGTSTVLGIGPGPSEIIDSVTSSLKLC